MHYRNAPKSAQLLLLVFTCWAACVAACADAVDVAPTITATQVGSGFADPLYVTHAPGDTGRIFVVEQPGVIKIVDISWIVSRSSRFVMRLSLYKRLSLNSPVLSARSIEY